MYIPKSNRVEDKDKLQQLMQAYPLAAWTTLVDGQLEVNHVPFLFDANKGKHGTLYGHIAKANKVWQHFSIDIESVCVFQGEQAYISPSWYPSKQAHGKAVPTWNYMVVHAYGTPIIHQDKAWLLAHLNALTQVHEQAQPEPWSIKDAPHAFIDKLSTAIVGIEIPVTQLLGKWKLGQNRSDQDQQGIVTGLRDDKASKKWLLADELESLGVSERE